MKYDSEPQKRLAAALVLAGDKPAICITEPEAGSAASEMTTRADRRGNGFVINGRNIGSAVAVFRASILFSRVSSTPTARRKGSEGLSLFATTDYRQARTGDWVARHSRGRDYF